MALRHLTFDPEETITAQFAGGLSFEGGGYAIGARPPAFRTEAAGQAHSASMPVTAWQINGRPARLSLGRIDAPL